MAKIGRVLLALLFSLGALALGFLVGFYFSFLFGANIHDGLPGISGLAIGLIAAILVFRATMKKLAESTNI